MALLPPTQSSQAWMSISSMTSTGRGSRDDTVNPLAAYLAATVHLPIFEEDELKRLETLASGTTFTAYKCSETETGRIVVVKKLLGISRRPISNQPSRIDSSVVQELLIASYPPFLKCKNIVSTLGFQHDVFTEPPLVSLVVEYSSMGTLEQYLASAAGSPEFDCNLKKKLSPDVASGLNQIHRCRIVHGDLKPANVLIFPSDNKDSGFAIVAKINDFGSSIIEYVDKEQGGFSSKEASYHGTPLWVPPIVRNSFRVSLELMPWCDVFSFGLIVWTIFKGKSYLDRSWIPSGCSDIQFLDQIGISGLVDHFQAYLIEVRGTMAPEEIQVFEQIVCGALEEKQDAATRSEDREENVKSAFEQIQKLKSILTQNQAAEESVPETSHETLWQPFHQSFHSFVGSEHFTWSMKTTLRTQHETTLNDVHSSPEQKAIAAQQLSSCSAIGFGCKKNIDDALKYLQASAEWGGVEAQLVLPRVFATFGKSIPDLKFPAVLYNVSSGSSDSEDDSDIDMDDLEEYDSTESDHDSDIDEDGSPPRGSHEHSQLVSPVKEYVTSDSNTVSEIQKYSTYELAKTLHSSFQTSDKDPDEYYCWTIQTFNEYFEIHSWNRPLIVGSREFLHMEDESLKKYLETEATAEELEQNTYYKPVAGVYQKISLLHHAIICHDQKIVETILGIDVDLALTDDDGRTPLHIACRGGNASIAQMLIEKGAKADARDSTGNSPLHWLWMFEDSIMAFIARSLISAGANVNDSTNEDEVRRDGLYSQDYRGTALHMAVAARNLTAVQTLLEIGADVDSRPYDSWLSPLGLAAQLHLPEIVEELLAAGAKLVAGGEWALHVLGIHIEPLKRWLIHGPLYKEAALKTTKILQNAADAQHLDISMEDDTENLSAFGLAISERGEDTYIVEAFLNCGIQAPETAFDLAVLSSSSDDQNASKLSLLFDRVDQSNLDWHSLLNIAIQNDAIEAIRILVEQAGKSLLAVRDTDYQTPLHWAAIARKPAAVRVLLELGADPDSMDRFAHPPLGYALLYKAKEAVRILLNAGANLWLNEPDGAFEGGTVLFFGLSGLDFFRVEDEHVHEQSMLGWLLSADLDEWKPRRFPMLHDHSIINAVVSEDNSTVLHEAARLGDYESVSTLVSAGASTTIKNSSGETPLGEAHLTLENEMRFEGNVELKEALAAIIAMMSGV